MNILHTISGFVSVALLVASWFFLFLGTVAVIRLPNMYSRMLTSSVVDTVTMLLILGGLLFYPEILASNFKIAILIIFLLITTPMTSHLIARSARKCNLPLDGGCRR